MGVDQQQKTFFQGRWQLDQEVKEVQFYGQEWYKLISAAGLYCTNCRILGGSLITFWATLILTHDYIFMNQVYLVIRNTQNVNFWRQKSYAISLFFGYIHGLVTDLQSILPSIFKQLLKHKKVLEFSRGIYQISTKVLKLKSEAKNRLSSWECML